jgi:hypothetical protein
VSSLDTKPIEAAVGMLTKSLIPYIQKMYPSFVEHAYAKGVVLYGSTL